MTIKNNLPFYFFNILN